MAMSYTKGAMIDMEKNGSIPKKGNTVITEETMHDMADSENEDDDTVLINGNVFAKNTDRKPRKYSGLMLKVLLVFLIAGVLVLSYLVHLLQNDLKTMHDTLKAQSSELAKNDKKDDAMNQALSGRIANLTNEVGHAPAVLKNLQALNKTIGLVYKRGNIFYPQYNARFIGFGYPSNRTAWEDHSGHTLDQCLEKLYKKRKKSKLWNGVVFAHSQKDGWCINYKNSGQLNVRKSSYMYYVISD